MMRRTNGEPQPTPRGVCSGFVGELTLEQEQFGALLIGDHSQVRLRLPTLEANHIREAGLLIERFVSYGRKRTGLPSDFMSVDDYVASVVARELSQLDE